MKTAGAAHREFVRAAVTHDWTLGGARGLFRLNVTLGGSAEEWSFGQTCSALAIRIVGGSCPASSLRKVASREAQMESFPPLFRSEISATQDACALRAPPLGGPPRARSCACSSLPSPQPTGASRRPALGDGAGTVCSHSPAVRPMASCAQPPEVPARRVALPRSAVGTLGVRGIPRARVLAGRASRAAAPRRRRKSPPLLDQPVAWL